MVRLSSSPSSESRAFENATIFCGSASQHRTPMTMAVPSASTFTTVGQVGTPPSSGSSIVKLVMESGSAAQAGSSRRPSTTIPGDSLPARRPSRASFRGGGASSSCPARATDGPDAESSMAARVRLVATQARDCILLRLSIGQVFRLLSSSPPDGRPSDIIADSERVSDRRSGTRPEPSRWTKAHDTRQLYPLPLANQQDFGV